MPRPDASSASTLDCIRVNVTAAFREDFNAECAGLATALEAIFLVHMADVAVPLSVIAVEEAVGEGFAAGNDVAERV